MKPTFFTKGALTVLGTILATGSSDGAVFTWAPAANSGNKNWNNATSWQGGVAPAVNSAGNDFVFGGGFKLGNTMEANYTVGGISFASGAGVFTLGGTGILTLGANGFANNSVNNQTIGIASLNLSSSQSWNATSGDMTFSGTSLNLGANTLTLAGGNDFFIANAISGTGGLNLTGGGTVSLSGANLYSGATTVSAGTLHVNNTTGSATGSSTVTLSGGRVTGGGTIAGPVIMQSGTMNAGNSGVGQITTGNLSLNGGTIVVEINQASGAAGTGHDLIIAPTLTLGGGSPIIIDVTTLTLANSQGLLADFDNTQSYSWEILRTAGINNFSESAFDIQLGNFVNDTGLGDFNVSSDGSSLFLNFTPVPEPSTLAFGGIAGVMLLGSMLRRRKK